MNTHRSRGFTLIEMVVAIAIGSLVATFVAMFLAAPLGAYEAQARRNLLVGEATAVLPRLQRDLGMALPNSVRHRVNGQYVALEMLLVAGVSRYTSGMSGTTFNAEGTSQTGVFQGVYENPLPANQLTDRTNLYLAVNPGSTVYTPNASMTAAGTRIRWTTAANGTGTVNVQPAPTFPFNSPKGRVYLVTGPVTYLCDANAGTVRRYSGYAVSPLQTSRDAPNEFSGAASELVARGVVGCTFNESLASGTQPQWVSARITARRTAGTGSYDTMTLLQQSRAEFAP